MASNIAQASKYSCEGLDNPSKDINVNSYEETVIGTLKGVPVTLEEIPGVDIGSKTVTENNGLRIVEPDGYIIMKIQNSNNAVGAAGKRLGTLSLLYNGKVIGCTAKKTNF